MASPRSRTNTGCSLSSFLGRTLSISPTTRESYSAIEECDDEVTIFVAHGRSRGDAAPVGKVPGAVPLAPFFFIDGASAIAALALGAGMEEDVLQMCAGSGGKGLVVASYMYKQGFDHTDPTNVARFRGKLVLNEVCKRRASLLQRVTSEFLPPALWDRSHSDPSVVLTSVDPGTQHNTMERHGPYDKILLDAPCTDDRLNLRQASSGAMSTWCAGRARTAAERQLNLLGNALWWLKEGGVILYCTSALSCEECDGVIERLLVKARGDFEIEVLPFEDRICEMVPGYAAEPTDWGVRILPDRTPYGPMYYSRLRLIRRCHDAGDLCRKAL